MTTEQQTTSVPSGVEAVDVYVALARLADVRVNEHTRNAIAKVREAYRTIEPVIREAGEILVMHEAEAAWIVADLQTSTPGFGEVDGLYQLMDMLSGSRELHTELQRLSELCDPDSMKNREAVEDARATLDAQRMSPEGVRMVRTAPVGGDHPDDQGEWAPGRHIVDPVSAASVAAPLVALVDQVKVTERAQTD